MKKILVIVCGYESHWLYTKKSGMSSVEYAVWRICVCVVEYVMRLRCGVCYAFELFEGMVKDYGVCVWVSCACAF